MQAILHHVAQGPEEARTLAEYLHLWLDRLHLDLLAAQYGRGREMACNLPRQLAQVDILVWLIADRIEPRALSSS